MVDASTLAATIAQIEKNYHGAAKSIRKGDSYGVVRSISTGSLELDQACGGGIPIGRMSRFWGASSSGKTLTSWNVIKNAMDLGMEAAYYNIEKQYHEEFVAARGIDISKLNVIDGTTIEDVGLKAEALMGSIHLHVIDSTSAAASVDQLTADMDSWQRGLDARAWGKVLSRLQEKFDNDENILIFISHARDTMKPGGGEHPNGGRMMEHFSSLTLYFKRGAWLWYDSNGILKPEGDNSKQTLSGLKEADGMEISVRVEKSRVCRPLRSARIRIDYDGIKFDTLYELTKFVRRRGIVKQAGAWYTLDDGRKVQGESGLRAILETDTTFRMQAVDAYMETMT